MLQNYSAGVPVVIEDPTVYQVGTKVGVSVLREHLPVGLCGQVSVSFGSGGGFSFSVHGGVINAKGGGVLAHTRVSTSMPDDTTVTVTITPVVDFTSEILLQVG